MSKIKLEKTGEMSKKKKAEENLSAEGKDFLEHLWNSYRWEAEAYEEWNGSYDPTEERAICFKTGPLVNCRAICFFDNSQEGHTCRAGTPLRRAEVEAIATELARRVRERYGVELKVNIARI